MLSHVSRALTYFLALLYAVTGAALFFLPEQMAPVFAWKVTPFIAMTIGGWCLGNAWLAWISARRWEWRLVQTSLIYLWLFGLIEMGVLIAFRGNLRLAHPIAWIYVTMLSVNVVAALFGLLDWLRIRSAAASSGPPVQKSIRIATIAFVIFVGFLGVFGMVAPNGAVGTNASIFPEIMSSFTLRAFGAFYLSLALAVLPLLANRNLAASLHHAFASYGLIVAITLAAFVYVRLFDFVQRPGGLLYFGAYLIVGIPLLFVFRRFGTGGPGASSG